MKTTAVIGKLETTVDRTPLHRAATATATRGSTSDPLAVRAACSDASRWRRPRADAFRRWFAARPSSAAVLRETLTTYLTANGIDDAASRMIVLCADEALINAVAHAAGSPVGVFADLRDDHFTLDVSDGGPGFDPSQIDTGAEPDLMGEHGRGLFLIHNLMDDFEILSDERGTTLHMERDLPGVRLSSRRRRGDLGAADVAAPGRGGGGLAGAHAASTPTPRPATSPEVAGGRHKSFAASPR